MEGEGSFFDLLREGYRKKKGVDVAKVRRENVLKRLKDFIKTLSRSESISGAIGTITEIQNIFENANSLEEYDMTRSDLDLILLMKAVVLTFGSHWQEAENMLYQLTEKYDETVFYALLGIVKNKRKIFKCCRDTLIVAQLQLNRHQRKPFTFHDIDVTVTNLTNAELSNSIKLMLEYTKNTRELPLNFTSAGNIVELNLVELNATGKINIGKIIRDVVFPIIRDRIDSMLRVREPERGRFSTDKSTQTEYTKEIRGESQSTQTENLTLSKGIQYKEVIKVAHKSTQTKLEKQETKKNKELSALKSALGVSTKENATLKTQLKIVNENLKSLQSEYKIKVHNLEQQIVKLRMINFDIQHSTQQLLEKVYKDIYIVQKHMYEEVKIKYDTVDAVVLALREDLEHLGLKTDLDGAINNTAGLRRDTINQQAEVEQRYQHIKQLIVSNQLNELLHVPLTDGVITEPQNVLLDFVAKLVPMCRNNRAYRAERRPNAPGTSFTSPVKTSEVDFPPIATAKKQRQQQKLHDQMIFDAYIAKVQSRLPNCSTEQIARCVNAIKGQRKIPLSAIGVQDVVDFLNSTVVSVRQNVNANLAGGPRAASIQLWDMEGAVDQLENICPICLDNCTDNTTILECTHTYHSACIREWLSSNRRCPICRHFIRLDVV